MAKDLFSRQSSLYARYRPAYPPALFESVCRFVTNRACAWDCATGNGQAALALTDYFGQVMASDISEKQLALAIQHPKVTYTVCEAEHTAFPDNTFDCITVAQAYHWFDFNAFATEARRVGKAGAVIAVWGYSLITAHDEAIDNMLSHFYTNIVGPYWDQERKYVDGQYDSIPFPFPQIGKERFTIDVTWQRDDLEGYLNTWSAVQHFIVANNSNPVDQFMKELHSRWPANEPRMVSFPVFLLLGRIAK